MRVALPSHLDCHDAKPFIDGPCVCVRPPLCFALLSHQQSNTMYLDEDDVGSTGLLGLARDVAAEADDRRGLGHLVAADVRLPWHAGRCKRAAVGSESVCCMADIDEVVGHQGKVWRNAP